jgi:arsenate reductase
VAEPRRFNVLFLCTGNSARSILAEAILNRLGDGRFAGYSAGSFPKGQVHPMSVELLQSLGYETRDLRSKSWDEFATQGAPVMDFVITVCDQAAGEVCPIWPGASVAAHWGQPDPAALADGEQARAAFRRALALLTRRIGELVRLPLESMDSAAQKRELGRIAKLV